MVARPQQELNRRLRFAYVKQKPSLCRSSDGRISEGYKTNGSPNILWKPKIIKNHFIKIHSYKILGIKLFP